VSKLLLSAAGIDRPGIVAGIAKALVDHKVNIEDSQMAILRGRFCMLLMLDASPDEDIEQLDADLQRAREQLGLDAVSLAELSEETIMPQPEPSCVIAVYGIDHPGIVHAITSKLAAADINITDLQTRLIPNQDTPVYAMVIEAALPDGLGLDDVEQLLTDVAIENEVELSVRELEVDLL